MWHRNGFGRGWSWRRRVTILMHIRWIVLGDALSFGRIYQAEAREDNDACRE
jgi:hypothetical protein